MLLAALDSDKKVGYLQAFFGRRFVPRIWPADSHVILRPRPGYVPKIPTTPFRVQVVNLQVLPWEEGRICGAFIASQFSSLRWTQLKFLPHPRQSGDPTCVFFHGMAYLIVSRVFPWQNHLPSLLCIDLTPGWLSLPQRRPYVVLPLVIPYV